MNAYFLHREVAHVIRLITAPFGGNVDERLVQTGQEFEASFDGCILLTIDRLARF
jgi:hypothetical protein